MRSDASRWLLLCCGGFVSLMLSALAVRPCAANENDDAPQTSQAKIVLNTRIRVREGDSDRVNVSEKQVAWGASKTALVICDMWDQHWCRGATSRVAEMAPRMNEVVTAARDKGVLIIHCPSSCMSFYKDTPMRLLAQRAPSVPTKVPLQNWCKLDPMHESPLPIDDSDGGCDCWPACAHGAPWKRQIATIEIRENDAVTDSGEAYFLMKQRGIDNVIVMGVHTNMCVLGRPFSIRQMVYQGQNVVLMRDMTDTMYNSRRVPYVPHVRGTDLVTNHIEQHWCPTITSTDFTGKPAFHFSEADRPHVVFMISEPEYNTKETLSKFAKGQLEPRGMRCTIVHADEADGNIFPGLEFLKTADLLFLSVRRRSPKTEQLALVREYLDSGKPLVGIRTASHAFHTRGQHPEGHAEWQELDQAVLGGNYTGHHGDGKLAQLSVADGVREHPILNGVSLASLVGHGSLYKVSPLAKSTSTLLIGTIPEQSAEPVAWTNTYQKGRVFYTSLGHPDDFNQPDFNKLLVNAVFWAINKH